MRDIQFMAGTELCMLCEELHKLLSFLKVFYCGSLVQNDIFVLLITIMVYFNWQKKSMRYLLL